MKPTRLAGLASFLAVLILGAEFASACLNDSLIDYAEQRYRQAYWQSVVEDSHPDAASDDLFTQPSGEFRRPLHPVTLETLDEHLAYFAEPSYPPSFWLKLGGSSALAVLLLSGAFAWARRERLRALREYVGGAAADLPPTLLWPKTVGTTVVLGIAVGVGVLVVDRVTDLDMTLTRTLAPSPTVQVPAPHHFPLRKTRPWRHLDRPADRGGRWKRFWVEGAFDGNENDRRSSLRARLAKPVTLRFAMVHDILHERYVRPGEAYYRARNARARQKLARLDRRWNRDTDERPPAEWFGHVDDLAVGLDRLGEYDEAEALLRDKLQLQKAADLPRYTTYANLGTVLAHRSAKAALSGAPDARHSLEEALSFIDKAITANPNAHFGREVWQKAAIEYLLYGAEYPDFLRRYDMVGNRLDVHRSCDDMRFDGSGTHYVGRELGDLSRPLFSPARYDWDTVEQGWHQVAEEIGGIGVRDLIRDVGAEGEWSDIDGLSQNVAVPFDDPVLGIVGMWRLGGGPNPHFALTLGGIMERVGRPRLAWAAYERAERLGAGWPESVRAELHKYCGDRKTELQAHLGESAAALRHVFDAELERGRDFQRKYLRFEREMLADGHSPDHHLQETFFAKHGRIASTPDDSEKVVVHGWMKPDWRTTLAALPWAFVLGGFLGLLRALFYAPVIDRKA
ncbi:hypothetical protein FIV42_25250 [Persicimonas caeni]|uniref:Tetratricopeptide repeat protein n=1 Tax=Persicimonas caeni TaxID=2292766 RepID=A0A4Y6Q0G1_PERCE|nr:hypothetical protein [Persicimonas caeni]QDG53929.1 hypothetical protein FIV42_25250 [Persicimonas caeni]QED35150.1 hypothetical protein FRD00_25245 [Persicimonas caeni]